MSQLYDLLKSKMRSALEVTMLWTMQDFLAFFMFKNHWVTILLIISLVVILELIVVKVYTAYQKTEYQGQECSCSGSRSHSWSSLSSFLEKNAYNHQKRRKFGVKNSNDVVHLFVGHSTDVFSERSILSLISEQNEDSCKDRNSLLDKLGEVMWADIRDSSHRVVRVINSSSDRTSLLSSLRCSKPRKCFRSHGQHPASEDESTRCSTKELFLSMKSNKKNKSSVSSGSIFFKDSEFMGASGELDVTPGPPCHLLITKDRVELLEDYVRKHVASKAKPALSNAAARLCSPPLQGLAQMPVFIRRCFAEAQDYFPGQNAIQNEVCCEARDTCQDPEFIQNRSPGSMQPGPKGSSFAQSHKLVGQVFATSTEDSLQAPDVDRSQKFIITPHAVDKKNARKGLESENLPVAQYSTQFEDSGKIETSAKGPSSVCQNALFVVLTVSPSVVVKDVPQPMASSEPTELCSLVPLSPAVKGLEDRSKTPHGERKLVFKVPPCSQAALHASKTRTALGCQDNTEKQKLQRRKGKARTALHLISVSKLMTSYMKKYSRKKLVKVTASLIKFGYFLHKQDKSPDTEKMKFSGSHNSLSVLCAQEISHIIKSIKEYGKENKRINDITPCTLGQLELPCLVNASELKTPYLLLETNCKSSTSPEGPRSLAFGLHAPEHEMPPGVMSEPRQRLAPHPQMKPSKGMEMQKDVQSPADLCPQFSEEEDSPPHALHRQRCVPISKAGKAPISSILNRLQYNRHRNLSPKTKASKAPILNILNPSQFSCHKGLSPKTKVSKVLISKIFNIPQGSRHRHVPPKILKSQTIDFLVCSGILPSRFYNIALDDALMEYRKESAQELAEAMRESLISSELVSLACEIEKDMLECMNKTHKMSHKHVTLKAKKAKTLNIAGCDIASHRRALRCYSKTKMKQGRPMGAMLLRAISLPLMVSLNTKRDRIIVTDRLQKTRCVHEPQWQEQLAQAGGAWWAHTTEEGVIVTEGTKNEKHPGGGEGPLISANKMHWDNTEKVTHRKLGKREPGLAMPNVYVPMPSLSHFRSGEESVSGVLSNTVKGTKQHISHEDKDRARALERKGTVDHTITLKMEKSPLPCVHSGKELRLVLDRIKQESKAQERKGKSEVKWTNSSRSSFLSQVNVHSRAKAGRDKPTPNSCLLLRKPQTSSTVKRVSSAASPMSLCSPLGSMCLPQAKEKPGENMIDAKDIMGPYLKGKNSLSRQVPHGKSPERDHEKQENMKKKDKGNPVVAQNKSQGSDSVLPSPHLEWGPSTRTVFIQGVRRRCPTSLTFQEPLEATCKEPVHDILSGIKRAEHLPQSGRMQAGAEEMTPFQGTSLRTNQSSVSQKLQMNVEEKEKKTQDDKHIEIQGKSSMVFSPCSEVDARNKGHEALPVKARSSFLQPKLQESLELGKIAPEFISDAIAHTIKNSIGHITQKEKEWEKMEDTIAKKNKAILQNVQLEIKQEEKVQKFKNEPVMANSNTSVPSPHLELDTRTDKAHCIMEVTRCALLQLLQQDSSEAREKVSGGSSKGTAATATQKVKEYIPQKEADKVKTLAVGDTLHPKDRCLEEDKTLSQGLLLTPKEDRDVDLLSKEKEETAGDSKERRKWARHSKTQGKLGVQGKEGKVDRVMKEQGRADPEGQEQEKINGRSKEREKMGLKSRAQKKTGAGDKGQGKEDWGRKEQRKLDQEGHEQRESGGKDKEKVGPERKKQEKVSRRAEEEGTVGGERKEPEESDEDKEQGKQKGESERGRENQDAELQGDVEGAPIFKRGIMQPQHMPGKAKRLSLLCSLKTKKLRVNQRQGCGFGQLSKNYQVVTSSISVLEMIKEENEGEGGGQKEVEGDGGKGGEESAGEGTGGGEEEREKGEKKEEGEEKNEEEGEAETEAEEEEREENEEDGEGGKEEEVEEEEEEIGGETEEEEVAEREEEEVGKREREEEEEGKEERKEEELGEREEEEEEETETEEEEEEEDEEEEEEGVKEREENGEEEEEREAKDGEEENGEKEEEGKGRQEEEKGRGEKADGGGRGREGEKGGGGEPEIVRSSVPCPVPQEPPPPKFPKESPPPACPGATVSPGCHRTQKEDRVQTSGTSGLACPNSMLSMTEPPGTPYVPRAREPSVLSKGREPRCSIKGKVGGKWGRSRSWDGVLTEAYPSSPAVAVCSHRSSPSEVRLPAPSDAGRHLREGADEGADLYSVRVNGNQCGPLEEAKVRAERGGLENGELAQSTGPRAEVSHVVHCRAKTLPVNEKVHGKGGQEGKNEPEVVLRQTTLLPSLPSSLNWDSGVSEREATGGRRQFCFKSLNFQSASSSDKKASTKFSNRKEPTQSITQGERDGFLVGRHDKMLPRCVDPKVRKSPLPHTLSAQELPPNTKELRKMQEDKDGLQTDLTDRISKLCLSQSQFKKSLDVDTIAPSKIIDAEVSNIKELKNHMPQKEKKSIERSVKLKIEDLKCTYFMTEKSATSHEHKLSDLEWKTNSQVPEDKSKPALMPTKASTVRSTLFLNVNTKTKQESEPVLTKSSFSKLNFHKSSDSEGGICIKPNTGDILTSVQNGKPHTPQNQRGDEPQKAKSVLEPKHQEMTAQEYREEPGVVLTKLTSLSPLAHLKLEEDTEPGGKMPRCSKFTSQAKSSAESVGGDIMKAVKAESDLPWNEGIGREKVDRRGTDVTLKSKKLLPFSKLYRSELNMCISGHHGKECEDLGQQRDIKVLRKVNVSEPSPLDLKLDEGKQLHEERFESKTSSLLSVLTSALSDVEKIGDTKEVDSHTRKGNPSVSQQERRDELGMVGVRIGARCQVPRMSPMLHILQAKEWMLNLKVIEDRMHKDKNEDCVAATRAFLSVPSMSPTSLDLTNKVDESMAAVPRASSPQPRGQSPHVQKASCVQKTANQESVEGDGKSLMKQAEHYVSHKEKEQLRTSDFVVTAPQRAKHLMIKSKRDANSQHEKIYSTESGSRSGGSLELDFTGQMSQPEKYEKESFAASYAYPTRNATEIGNVKKEMKRIDNLKQTVSPKDLGLLSPREALQEMQAAPAASGSSKGLSVSEIDDQGSLLKDLEMEESLLELAQKTLHLLQDFLQQPEHLEETDKTNANITTNVEQKSLGKDNSGIAGEDKKTLPCESLTHFTPEEKNKLTQHVKSKPLEMKKNLLSEVAEKFTQNFSFYLKQATFEEYQQRYRLRLEKNSRFPSWTPSLQIDSVKEKDKLLMHFSVKTLEIKLQAFPRIVRESYEMVNAHEKWNRCDGYTHSVIQASKQTNRILALYDEKSLRKIELNLQQKYLRYLQGFSPERTFSRSNVFPKHSHDFNTSCLYEKVDDSGANSLAHDTELLEKHIMFKEQHPHENSSLKGTSILSGLESKMALVKEKKHPVSSIGASMPKAFDINTQENDAGLGDLQGTSVLSGLESKMALVKEKKHPVSSIGANMPKAFDINTQENDTGLGDLQSRKLSDYFTDEWICTENSALLEEFISSGMSDSDEIILLGDNTKLACESQKIVWDIQDDIPSANFFTIKDTLPYQKPPNNDAGSPHVRAYGKHTLNMRKPSFDSHRGKNYRSPSNTQLPNWGSSLGTQSMSSSKERFLGATSRETSSSLSNFNIHIAKKQNNSQIQPESKERKKRGFNLHKKKNDHWDHASYSRHTHNKEKSPRKNRTSDYQPKRPDYSRSQQKHKSTPKPRLEEVHPEKPQSKPFVYACRITDSMDATPETIRWTIPANILKTNSRAPQVAKKPNSLSIGNLVRNLGSS